VKDKKIPTADLSHIEVNESNGDVTSGFAAFSQPKLSFRRFRQKESAYNVKWYKIDGKF
jgi:hypothetical protein